ncbi:glycosyltransferase family 4 protein [Flavobacteriaceae bacterium]|nr:glycosyltransferase family 4 protein [Flavobacteriaceae bacterium]
MNKKLLFVSNDLDFFLSHRLPLAIEAEKEGYIVYVASDKIPKKKIGNIYFKKYSIYRSSTSITKNLKSLMELKAIFKEISPDIIHSITLKSILLSNLVLLFNRKVKKVNAVSGLGYLFTSNRVSIALFGLKFILRGIITLRRPHFIFQNSQDLNEIKKLGLKGDYSLIKGSGVNKDEFDYIPPRGAKKINITFTGRILKDKGVLELIKAIEILPKEISSKVVLNIYGKIDLENPAHITEKELKKLLKPNFIVWHGNSNDIKNVLALSDIYCLPSYREGLPKSTLEAMAIGRPIITTNAPGCEDTVLEGINGYKVNVKDHKALSEKLQLLIEDEPLRLKMGKKSRDIFEENFTLDKVVKQTFELYDSLIVKN